MEKVIAALQKKLSNTRKQLKRAILVHRVIILICLLVISVQAYQLKHPPMMTLIGSSDIQQIGTHTYQVLDSTADIEHFELPELPVYLK